MTQLQANEKKKKGCLSALMIIHAYWLLARSTNVDDIIKLFTKIWLRVPVPLENL